MKEYRACVLTDGQHSVVLTGPEHRRWSDAEMLAEAEREMERSGAQFLDDDGVEYHLAITDWVDTHLMDLPPALPSPDGADSEDGCD